MGNKEVYKTGLAKEYAKIAKISQVEAKKRVNDVFELIAQHLENGDSVKITNYFNFFVKVRPEKKGVNPRTGESVMIPPTKTVHVKMSNSMKRRIKGK